MRDEHNAPTTGDLIRRIKEVQAERDALRDGIRALADETPHKTTDHLGNVTGYLIGADDLRALLDREEAQ